MIIEEQGPDKAFQTAGKNGHSKVVEFLIQNSKKFDFDLNSNVAAAFQMACKKSHSKMVEVLIKNSKNSDFDQNSTVSGKTPFQFACENGHTEMAEMLITVGLNMYVTLKKMPAHAEHTFDTFEYF